MIIGNVISVAKTFISGINAAAIKAMDGIVAFLFESSEGNGATFTGDFVGDNRTSGRAIQPGRCYDFDGVDDYIELSNESEFDFTDGFSVSFWVKPDTLPVNTRFINKGITGNGEWMISSTSSNNLRVFCKDDAGNSNDTGTSGVTASLTLGEWANICVVFDKTNQKIKVSKNGGTFSEYANTSTWTGGFLNSHPVNIGRIYTGSGYIDGKLRDIRIWDTELTQAQVISVYNSETDIAFSNLKYLGKCEESAGSTAYDSSGNANHGTITNATLSTFHATDTGVTKSYANDVGYNAYDVFDGVGNELEITKISGVGEFYIRAKFVMTSDFSNYSGLIGDGQATGRNRILISASNGIFIDINGSNVSDVNFDIPHNEVCDLEIYRDFAGDIYAELNGGGDTLIGNIATSTKFEFSYLFSEGASQRKFPGVPFYLEYASSNGGSTLGRWSSPGNWEDEIGSNDADLTGSTTEKIIISRNENLTTKDVVDENLNFTGRVKYDFDFKSSNCLTFDGVDDYVDISSALPDTNLMLGTGITVACWAKRNGNAGSANMLFSHRDQSTELLQCALHSTNGVTMQFRSSTNTLYSVRDTSVDDTVWHHYAFVFDFNGDEMRLYVDGVESDQTNIVSSGSLDSAESYLGARSSTGGGPNGGYAHVNMANVFIKQSVLSDANILAIYNGTYSGSCLARYPLAEGAGSTVYDISGNDNHGTLTNFTLSNAWGTTQDVFHYNILNGFEEYDDDATGLDIIRVPYKTDGTQITPTISGYTKNQNNDAGNFHNDAETKIAAPECPALRVADEAKTTARLYSGASSVEIGYSDFEEDFDSEGFYFSDVSTSGEYKNLLIFDEEKTGSDLTDIQTFLNH